MKQQYSQDEALKASLEYFGGDELAARVWVNKYALKDSFGNIYESTPQDMHWRIANEIARIESKYENPMSAQEVFDLLDKFKYIVPSGSPMTGIGNEFHPIDLDLSGWHLVVVKPDVFVSTKEAYSGVKPAIPQVRLTEALQRPIGEWQGVVKNDFEPHIFDAHPAIAELKKALLDAGALYASMSGSGSALFALYDKEPRIEPSEDTFLHVEQL